MASCYIEINIPPGAKRKQMGRTPGLLKTLNGGTIKIKLNDNKTWEMLAPFNPEWRYYAPDYPSGSWTDGYTYELKGLNGDQCFRLYKPETSGGDAIYGIPGTSLGAMATWTRTARPLPASGTGCWTGLALKGSAGVVMEGEEVMCLVHSWDNSSKGAWFNILSARLGLVGGFAGGLAFVLVTGFPDINTIHNFTVSGWDWTLTFGAKVGSVIKMGTMGPKLLKIIEGINRMEDVVKAMKAAKNDKEIIGMGKAMYDNWGYDFAEPKVTVVDVPLLGTGAEAGVYVYAGSCKLFRSW